MKSVILIAVSALVLLAATVAGMLDTFVFGAEDFLRPSTSRSMEELLGDRGHVRIVLCESSW